MNDLSWLLILGLSVTGIGMALLSSLVGLRAKRENPLWWALYALWVLVVLNLDVPSPFLTILISSVLAGVWHGITQALLVDRWVAHNPWYADKAKGPREKLARRFVLTSPLVGLGFGALVGLVAWGLSRL